MASDRPWLAAVWPFVRGKLPAAPASVLEVGCGSLGGFVPPLLTSGYDAVGVDPEAPEGPAYRTMQFEEYELPQQVDCVVASTSLHHVADLDDVLNRVTDALVPGGVLVVVEWAWERFDEATAMWSFSRLDTPSPDAEPGWLQRHRDHWMASEQPWDAYLSAWVNEEGLHPGGHIMRKLDDRFERRMRADGPHFFADLADTTEADEQAAIDAGRIQATGIRYVGIRP
jgi:SAM-dependent methyltransferase